MEKAIQMFNDIKQDAPPVDYLKKLALAVQQSVRVHPFEDGNNRTLINCLLVAYLLIKGLPPAIFKEPNIFEFHTVSELMQITREEMRIGEFAVKNRVGI